MPTAPSEPILHVDMDAFYAAVEVLRDRTLAGKPVVVGSPGPRGVVMSASYEARKFHIHSAMPSARARRLCPDAVFVPPDFSAYRAYATRLREILLSFTPLVEPLSLDEAFLDVSGATTLFGAPPVIAGRIRSRIREDLSLAASVGVAQNKLLAKLASVRAKPDGLVVVAAGSALEFLHPLPVTALWGVGERTHEVLGRLGVRTVGELAGLPARVLERTLGEGLAEHLAELAAGRDGRPVVPYEAPKQVSHEETFDRDLDAEIDVTRELLRLSSHEALIRGWPRLRGWLEEDRAGLRTHRRLTEAAQEWERLERDPDALYRGARLTEASEWAERNPGALNELEEEFLRESAEAEARARRSRVRRLRVAAGALGTGLVIVAVLAIVAFLQKGRADEQQRLARSREIAAAALEQLERDPQLSLILAIEAYETAPTAQADAAIRGALVSSPLRKVLDVGAPASVDVSPDGKLIATQTVFGEVALWDRASGRRLKVLQAGANPEGTEFPGIEGPPIETISFSPDGKLLFAGVDEGSFSPEGKPLSLGKASGRIWTVPDGRPALRLEGALYSGGWAPDGSALLTVGPPKLVGGPPEGSPGSPEPPPEGSPGSPEAPPEGPPQGPQGAGIVRLWDISTGEVRAEFRREEFGDPFTFAFLSPDGRLVAIEEGAENEAVHVKSASTGRTVGVFEGRLFPHNPFSADGRLLVLSGPGFERARVFDVASGRLVRDLRPGSGVYDAALSPDGSRVVTGQIVGGRIWEVKSGRFVELSGHAGAIIQAAFSLDGSRVLTLSEDNQGRVWDAETGRVLAVLAGGTIGSASLTPDGRSVVTSGGDEARIWEVGGAAALVFRGHEAPVVSARFSPDGHSVISSDVGGGTARVWVAETGVQTSVLRPPELPGDELLLNAEFSADGKLAVMSGQRLGSAEGQGGMPAALWDLATETVRREFHPTPADPLGPCESFEGCSFEDAALSSDGTRLATAGGDGILRIWDAEDGSELQTIRVSEKTIGPEKVPLTVSGVEWAPDGKTVIALSGDGFLHLFDATTLKQIREFGVEAGSGGISVLHPEVSRDGSLVAVGYPDGTARVWETPTGRPVAELPHAGPVYDVGFSPEGGFLVTASGDAPTIWDLESQRPLTQLFGHRAAVISVDFSGSSIVSASEDETVRVWRCEVCAPIDQLLDLARERALRELTPAERARFLHQG